MKYEATLFQGDDGNYTASCDDPAVIAHGLSAISAIEALKSEIRYHVELCPCSSVTDDWVEVDVKHG